MINTRVTALDEVSNIYFINLNCRKDRLKHAIEQCSSIGFNCPIRIDAIQLANGAIGCSLSHIKALERAKREKLENVIIVEDDITFLNPSLFTSQINGFLRSNRKWDMVLLAGNNSIPFTIFNKFAVKVNRCQTTTGYLINSSYYDTLITNIKEGVRMLINEPENHRLYAVDKYWFKLQCEDEWYLITPLTVIQKMDYSNIEKRITNYEMPMLTLNKASHPRYCHADSTVSQKTTA